MIKRKGSAAWQGGIKDGSGTVSTESGALSELPYSFAKRFEGEKGTNPEELIGAAHASCFSMALSLILGEAGVKSPKIEATSTVKLDKAADGFAITAVHLDVTIAADGADGATLLDCADKAKAG